MSYVLLVFDRLRSFVRFALRASCGLHIIDTADKTAPNDNRGGEKEKKIESVEFFFRTFGSLVI